jgi:hypothetical protein
MTLIGTAAQTHGEEPKLRATVKSHGKALRCLKMNLNIFNICLALHLRHQAVVVAQYEDLKWRFVAQLSS